MLARYPDPLSSGLWVVGHDNRVRPKALIMTKPPSPTQPQTLATSAQHPPLLAEAPPNLPAAARNAVFQSMLRAGLLEEVSAADEEVRRALRITAAGLKAVGEPRPAEPAKEAVRSVQEDRGRQSTSVDMPEIQKRPVAPAVPQPRPSLRGAATALLVAWDAGVERSALPASIEALRAALGRSKAIHPARDPSVPRRPREGTK